uniref:Uncharacterized protein n=1 Tax=Setaria italica TaxID=4555 RepID=K3ZVP2_SETIT
MHMRDRVRLRLRLTPWRPASGSRPAVVPWGRADRSERQDPVCWSTSTSARGARGSVLSVATWSASDVSVYCAGLGASRSARRRRHGGCVGVQCRPSTRYCTSTLVRGSATAEGSGSPAGASCTEGARRTCTGSNAAVHEAPRGALLLAEVARPPDPGAAGGDAAQREAVPRVRKEGDGLLEVVSSPRTPRPQCPIFAHIHLKLLVHPHRTGVLGYRNQFVPNNNRFNHSSSACSDSLPSGLTSELPANSRASMAKLHCSLNRGTVECIFLHKRNIFPREEETRTSTSVNSSYTLES